MQKGIPRKYKSGGSFDTAFDLSEWFGSKGFRTYPGTLFVSNIVTAMSATVFLSPGPLVSMPNAYQRKGIDSFSAVDNNRPRSTFEPHLIAGALGKWLPGLRC